MDVDNEVIKLCVAGTRAEFEGDLETAARLYRQAWDVHMNDYEACIAAHYLARFQTTPEERLRWNLEALIHANLVADDCVKDFYPSLYLNIGQSYENCGRPADAEKYYELAARLGVVHSDY